MFDIDVLKGKKLPELQEIAAKLRIAQFKTLKKMDLVYQILDVQASNPTAEEVKPKQKAPRRRILKPNPVEKIIEKSEIEILEQKIIDSCEQGAELLIEAKRGKFDNYWKYSQQKDTRDNIIQLLKEYKDAINTLEINNPSTKT